MSTASLASARKRRAPISATPLAPNSPAPTAGQQMRGNASQSVNGIPAGINPNALTLPQVITLVDQRLVVLENHMKDNLRRQDEDSVMFREPAQPTSEFSSELLDEFNNRFETLAQEIENMKRIVLNLQSYTMEVNKTLLNERIRILGGEDAGIQLSDAM